MEAVGSGFDCGFELGFEEVPVLGLGLGFDCGFELGFELGFGVD